MTDSNNSVKKLALRIFITSLGTVFEIVAISLILSFPIRLVFIGLVASIIAIIYGWDFFVEYEQKASKTNKRLIIFFLLTLLAIFLALIIHLNNNIITIISVLLLIAGLNYDSFFKKISARIPGFKDLFVILCFETLVFLFLLYNDASKAEIILIITFTSIRDFINITYCDIKDISADKIKGLKTIVGTIGVSKLIKFHYLLSLTSLLVIIVGVHFEVVPIIFAFLAFPVIITTLLIYRSAKLRSYSPNNVDIEYIGWLIFIYLGKIIVWP